ncbi:MAG: hypothetical protein QOI58_2931 [Thermoanaerobaculia bacterium]|jgi:hypothetical protein|nr:hypothetical protein [Thermoanaerobaculia bacterium]
MKRSLAALLLILAFTTTSGAATTRKKARKASKKTTTIEQTAQAGGAVRATNIRREKKQSDSEGTVVPKPGPIPFVAPVELQLKRASSRRFDLRGLPQTKPIQLERAELEDPTPHPVTVQGTGAVPEPSIPSVQPTAAAPAPAPINVFEGLDRFNWGAGSPPDTNGDVGPNNYIQTVNTSIGVFRKSDGFQQAAFTFNTFMSQGAFGNLCDTNNFGDPVVLYDTFENRWIITDFAFLTDASGNVLAPAFQCFAASMTGDPVAGGWNFYSIQITDALNDYEKFGIWPDGLYMSANMFTFGANSAFKTARAWAFNKAQMYAGSPTVKVVTFDIPGGDFAVMPSNARLQTGTPPPGRPNLFMSTWQFTNAVTIYKFHVDWNSVALSTFTGPDTPLAATSWPNANVANAAQPGTSQLLDVLQIRAMVQNQYTNFGGTESLWIPHTVRRGNTTGLAAPRFYQANVTGGTVAANLVQAATFDPDAANVINRFMPSLALDRAGNMAMGYSTSNSTAGTGFPSIKYAGRLAADPVNTFSQTEQVMFTGTASQLSSTRWGDYSGMALDPDGCTFWYTSEYATGLDTPPVPPATTSPGFNQRWKTKFGLFGPFPGCTPVGAGGTVSGTVTVNPGGAPISGATVNLGAGRSTTTDGSGNYSFTGIPAGTYPSMTATKPGFVSGSASSIVVTDGGTTTQNFSLTAAPPSACLTDTTQADFQAGIASATIDINTSPGDVTLSNAPASDQANTAGTTTGTGFGTPNWTGQTFIAGVSGLLVKADGQLFCNGCGATPPDLTLSLRATAAGLPTGADLATATISGAQFASGATVLFTGTFGTPVSITSGTQYALILRPVSAPAGSGYFWIRSSPSTYANGSRVLSADSGATWSADTTRDFNFRTYVQTGYAASGNFVSSPKDSNPAGGNTPIWSTFSWNATVPANTTLQFQLAGSNNPNGPFNFVGPDGTAGTFFTTSPVQLSPQFYNLRFLEYKAFFATTNSAVTPTLNDATACFNDVNCSSTVATITPTPATVCSNSTGNTASGPAGMTTYAWGIANGTITSATNTQSITYTAGASGTVTLSLTITAPNGCIVSGSTPVTISGFPATPTITPTPASVCANSTGNTAAGPAGATTYAWSIVNGTITSATNIQTITYTAGASGTVDLTLTVTNAAGCATPNTVNVPINANPATPTITPTPASVCANSTGNSAAGPAGATSYAWSITNGTITSATNIQTITYTAGASGTVGLTLVVTNASGCSATNTSNVTINANPATPTITPTPAAVCASSTGNSAAGPAGATSYAWSITNGTITSATNIQTITYTAGASGTVGLTLVVTNASGCSATNTSNVTINANPATPTITPTPAAVCASSTGNSAAGPAGATSYAWSITNGTITSATNIQTITYTAGASGTVGLTLVVTNASGCSATNTVNVTINAKPNATITAASSTPSGSTGNVASVANAGVGATYAWSVTGGTLTGGNNTPSITYTAGAAGTLTINVTVTNAAGCSDAKSANVTVTAPPVTVTSVSPVGGTIAGGSAVTINGTGFNAGATVTFGGSAATNVVVVSSIKITARTPAHAAGAVNVTVTNTDTSNGTLTNGYLYKPQQFDPNNDGTISPMDIIYLINYLYMGGPPPAGAAGLLSGDANGDGVVNPLDIFYLINYLFLGGPRPNSIVDRPVTSLAIGTDAPQLDGSIALGKPVLREGRYFVPVIMTANKGSIAPQAMSLRVHFDGEVGNATIRKAGAAKDLAVAFETNRLAGNDLSYLVSYGNLSLGTSASAVVAEIEIESSNATLSIDPQLTMLSNQAGTMTASVANGKLQVTGVKIGNGSAPQPRTPDHKVN